MQQSISISEESGTDITSPSHSPVTVNGHWQCLWIPRSEISAVITSACCFDAFVLSNLMHLGGVNIFRTVCHKKCNWQQILLWAYFKYNPCWKQKKTHRYKQNIITIIVKYYVFTLRTQCHQVTPGELRNHAPLKLNLYNNILVVQREGHDVLLGFLDGQRVVLMYRTGS